MSFCILFFSFHFLHISLFCFVFVDFVLLSLVSFYFVFISLISFRFVSFLLISFRFVSFSLISFRFVSFLFRFALYRYPSICTIEWKRIEFFLFFCLFVFFFLYCFVYLYCSWRFSYQEREGSDLIYRYNPGRIFVCLCFTCLLTLR